MKSNIMVMGIGPRSGKTVVILGLCRALSNRGVSVAPFKAICVIRGRDIEDRTFPMHAHGFFHQVRAARLPFHDTLNPIAVLVTDPFIGNLYIEGEYVQHVRLLNDDTVFFQSIPENVLTRMKQAVTDAFQVVSSIYDCVIIEGAGCPSEVSPEEDIPNIYVSTLTQAPILISARASRGGAGSSIIGTYTTVPEHIRTLVCGYILGDVHSTQYIEYTKKMLEKHLDIPDMGTISSLSLEEYSDEEAYEIIAQATEQGLNQHIFDQLMGNE